MRAVVAVAAAVMALTLLPYLAALQLAQPGDVFSGFIWGVDDGNVYLSWIRQASEGHILLANQYTTDPQNPHFFNLFLLFAGLLCRITGLAPIYIFHSLRVLGGVFMLASFYWLVSLLTADRWIRWAALGLAALGSGLGWVVVLFDEAGITPGIHPVDAGVNWQVQPEAVTFLSALLNPLFITSMGLICLTLGHALIALEQKRLRSAVGAGVLLLILGNIHSYDVFTIHATLGVWIIYGLLTRRYSFGQAALAYAVIFFISAPAPLWSYWAANQDPSYLVKAMTPTPSAGFVNYLVGYGLLVVFAIVGATRALTPTRSPTGRGKNGIPRSGSGLPKESRGTGFLACGPEPLSPGLLRFAILWAVANSVMLALPVSFQRKLVEGLHMPIAILAGVGVVYLARLITNRAAAAGKLQSVKERMALTVVAAIVICLPSNALLVSQCMENVRTNNELLLHVLAPPIYLSADYANVASWLGDHTTEQDVVLSSSLFGNHIPAAASCKVYAGHWAETLYFSRKLGKVAEFFSPGTEVERRLDVLCGDVGARYVVYGPYERLIGRSRGGSQDDADILAATAGFLEPVFTSGDVTVLKASFYVD